MAKTINTVGSQLFQRNLSDYERQENRDDILARAEANKLGNQLTALGLDPDINDSGLAKIGAAAKADPGGIVGNIASAIGTIKQADAMKLKADANNDRAKLMADMIKSNFGEMTDAEAMAYARDPKAFGQFMDITDFKNREQDRQRRINREDKEESRADEEYDRTQELAKAYKDLEPELTEQFQTILGMDPSLARITAQDPSKRDAAIQQVWSATRQSNQVENLYKQYEETIFEATNGEVNSLEKFKAMQDMPPALAKAMLENGAIKKARGYYDSLLDNRTQLIERYNSEYANALPVAINEVISDQEAYIYYNQNIAEKNEDGVPREDAELYFATNPKELPGVKNAVYSAYLRGDNAENFQKRIEDSVKSRLQPIMSEMNSNATAISNTQNQYGEKIATPMIISSLGYLDSAINTMRPGTFFIHNGGKYKVVQGADGKNTYMPELEFSEDDQRSFNSRYGMSSMEDALISISPNTDQVGGDILERMPSGNEVSKVSNDGSSIKASKVYGFEGQKEINRKKEKRTQEMKGFQRDVKNIVDIAANEVGVDSSVFNFDVDTIGETNNFGTIVTSSGKPLKIGFPFELPPEKYTGFMNYKQFRGGNAGRRVLMYSQPIEISEFIKKINLPNAEEELGLTSELVEDYRKLINRANERSEKMNSLGYEEGKYPPEIKDIEKMLQTSDIPDGPRAEYLTD